MESYSDHNYVFGYAAAMETKATKQYTMAELLYALEDKWMSEYVLLYDIRNMFRK